MALHDATSLANRGQQQANVAIAFLVLAWVFLALRIFTRTYVIANFGWDDSTILCAGVMAGRTTRRRCELTVGFLDFVYRLLLSYVIYRSQRRWNSHYKRR